MVKRELAYFAPASRGTEDVLAEELRDQGCGSAEARRGGVAFGDDLEHAYRACLWSRIASRVLYPVARFDADDAEAYYEGVRSVRWVEHLSPDATFSIGAAGGRSPAGPPYYLALKAKDAIVDSIRDAVGRRPDVDTADPDVRVHVHLRETAVTVSIDLAGRGLHTRGVERAGASAPLKENLAAALLWLADWRRGARGPLCDPMCGSATLLTEAVAIALDVAPGLRRGRFGAEAWIGHDPRLWGRLLAEARERKRSARGGLPKVYGMDASREAVRAARRHVSAAGFGAHVSIEARALADVEAPPGGPGLVVTNPPYGARLGEAGELGPVYEQLGDVLKRRFAGWSAFVLSGNRALDKRVGLRPSARHIVFNGPIECRWLAFPIASAPVSGGAGPAWRRASADAAPFAKKLRANLREAVRRARREGITAYRVYDADIPEWNVAVDWYDGAVRVEEYHRPKKVPEAVAERRLRDVMHVVPEVLDVDPADVVLRVRRRRGPREQVDRFGDTGRFREVREGDLRFRVNVHDYLDTGLFLDDRGVRAWIRDHARDRAFLNLFAYTCTASVAAAAGGARSTTSVDLSNVYLGWGRDNFRLNGQLDDRHAFVRADVAAFLRGRDDRRGRGPDRRVPAGERYDLAFVAPPTWSRSKGMRGDFDVQRDHPGLLGAVARRLAPGGRILFTTNLRTFAMDPAVERTCAVREITEAVTPHDFARRPRIRAWVLEPDPRG